MVWGDGDAIGRQQVAGGLAGRLLPARHLLAPLLIEPGFWFGVPAANFAGWFGVSALLLFAAPRPIATSRWSAAIGISTLVFFAVIGAIHG